MASIARFFSIPQKLRSEVEHFDDVLIRDGIIYDLTFPSRLHEFQGAEEGELMRDRALPLPREEADIRHAHLLDEEGGEDLHAGGVAENGEKIRKVGEYLILRKIIAYDALVAAREAKGRIHILILQVI